VIASNRDIGWGCHLAEGEKSMQRETFDHVPMMGLLALALLLCAGVVIDVLYDFVTLIVGKNTVW
jgi:hypothetical protein